MSLNPCNHNEGHGLDWMDKKQEQFKLYFLALGNL